jgi:hypothetical protein
MIARAVPVSLVATPHHHRTVTYPRELLIVLVHTYTTSEMSPSDGGHHRPAVKELLKYLDAGWADDGA